MDKKLDVKPSHFFFLFISHSYERNQQVCWMILWLDQSLAAWCLMITCLWESRMEEVYVWTVPFDLVKLIVSVALPGCLGTRLYAIYCVIRPRRFLDWSFCPLILEYSVDYLYLFSWKSLECLFKNCFPFTCTYTYKEQGVVYVMDWCLNWHWPLCPHI